MKVPGSLRLTTLGDVLGGIFREGASGVLELTELHGPRSGMVHRVHLVSGLVVQVDAAFPGTRLGDMLLQSGLVDPSRIRRCATLLATTKSVRMGQLLLDSGALSEFALSEALRLQRKERLERLFELEDARVTFHVARKVSGRDALPPPQFLHGRKRHRDRPIAKSAERRQSAAPRPSATATVHAAEPGMVRRDPARSRALATLGLDLSADSASVKRAFRDLARSLHPDCHPGVTANERAELMRSFAEITAAYHTLVA